MSLTENWRHSDNIRTEQSIQNTTNAVMMNGTVPGPAFLILLENGIRRSLRIEQCVGLIIDDVDEEDDVNEEQEEVDDEEDDVEDEEDGTGDVCCSCCDTCT